MRTVAVFAVVLIFSGLVLTQDKPVSSPASPSQAAPSEDSTVYRVGGGVKPPRFVYTPGPKFTDEEKKNGKARYTGVVVLKMIVTTEGKAKDIKVTKSLGPGLDNKAIEAVKTWKFDPATKDGNPVMVEVMAEIDFALY